MKSGTNVGKLNRHINDENGLKLTVKILTRGWANKHD